VLSPLRVASWNSVKSFDRRAHGRRKIAIRCVTKRTWVVGRFASEALAVTEEQDKPRGGVMTKIAEVMTDRPRAITPQTSIRDAARLMEEEDVGSLPVVEEGARLVGIVTDRDIAIRAVAHGLEPERTTIMDIASKEVYGLTPDDDLDEALEMMARAQVRRLPIVVRDNELVGMVAQADVARTSKEKATGEVVEAISQSPHGPRVSGAAVSGAPDSPAHETDRRRDVGSERAERAPEYERGRAEHAPDA
jgi:CBS domain-containing protein